MNIFLAGSAAEFYIKPNGSYIGDLDFMCQRKYIVAEFEDGYRTKEIDDRENKFRVQNASRPRSWSSS